MYKRLPLKKLSGQELFKNTKNKFSVSDFWQYGFSNLNSNVLRGALAEFLVENAIKDKQDISIRNPWGDYDVKTKQGIRIEVKCSSYIQDWDQHKLSNIIFSGLKARTLYWSSAVGDFPKDNKKEYKADIYILALLKHQDPMTLNILDLDQWCFYVLSKKQLKEVSSDKSSVSLARLEKYNIKPVSFNQINKLIK